MEQMNAPKYAQTNQEILGHLRDQIGFILSSAASYDNGFEGEAKRLAIAIRILVHDTNRSISLLAQLGKRNIPFYDSANPAHPENLLSTHRLIMVKISTQGGEFEAPLDNGPPSRSTTKKIGFERLWRTDIVFKDKLGSTFSRKDIILSFADNEGGAHIDPLLDQSYAQLSRFNSLGWKHVVNEVKKDFPSPVPPSVRQIAHEVLKTLKDEFPDEYQEASRTQTKRTIG